MKQIRKLLFVLLATPFIYSCGDAGVGFDVAAELPIDVGTLEVPIEGSPFAAGSININPESISFNYSLSDVDGFQDAVDELNDVGAEIFLNSISYELSGVNDATDTFEESVGIESIRMDFSGISTPLEITFPGGVLDNISKTSIGFTNDLKESITSRLENGQDLSVDFVFDLGSVTIPESDEIIDFDIQVYFDVAIRVRDIAN